MNLFKILYLTNIFQAINKLKGQFQKYKFERKKTFLTRTKHHYSKRAMIFIHLFNNFCDNLVFLSSYWLKTVKRKSKRKDKNIM